jgi:hypothetical protein
MATCAAFGLDGHMLEDKRALQIAMAFETDLILALGRALGMRQSGAVRAVAIGAANQSFIDAMPERLGEVGLPIRVTAIAEVGLLFDQQLAGLFRRMGRMARDAAQAVIRMSRTLKVGVLLTQPMARKTAFANDFRRLPLEEEDFCLVSAAVNVFGAGAVTRFAAVCLGPFLRFQNAVPVPGLLKVLE